jgi:hypothetical protein
VRTNLKRRDVTSDVPDYLLPKRSPARTVTPVPASFVTTGGIIGLFRRAPKTACLPRSRNGVYLFLRRYTDDLSFAKDRRVFENGRVLYPRQAVERWLKERLQA